MSPSGHRTVRTLEKHQRPSVVMVVDDSSHLINLLILHFFQKTLHGNKILKDLAWKSSRGLRLGRGRGRVWVEQSLVLQTECLRGQPKCPQGQRGPRPSERGRGNREQHNPVGFVGSCKTPLGTTRTISWGWQVEEGFKRKGTHVSRWLIHADVWHKPTQHCKAIIY